MPGVNTWLIYLYFVTDKKYVKKQRNILYNLNSDLVLEEFLSKIINLKDKNVFLNFHMVFAFFSFLLLFIVCMGFIFISALKEPVSCILNVIVNRYKCKIIFYSVVVFFYILK